MADRLITLRGATAAEARTITRRGRSGRLRRLSPGLYTDNTVDDEARFVRRNAIAIAAALFPGAVLSGRSGVELVPASADEGDVLFLSDGQSRRTFSGLAGLDIRFDGGPGALPGDVPHMGLHRASEARQFLENLMPSRMAGGVARTLGQAAVEGQLEKICVREGEQHLNVLRDQARALAPMLGADVQFDRLDEIVGTILGTRSGALSTGGARARAAGAPYDPECVRRLVALRRHLDSVAIPPVADTSSGPAARQAISFVEAYFSNYIEGTRFPLDEARRIVFEGEIPVRRPRDGHDVLETFRQTAALGLRAPSTLGYPEFRDEIRSRHADLMGPRTEVAPGMFKDSLNQAGNTVFVDPSLVEGTLRAGMDLLSDLRPAFSRALMIHFMLTDVHPFNDGNGRLGRIMTTKELLADGRSRIVVPTVHREDYVGTLRLLSRDGRPEAFVRCMAFCQQVTAAAAARTIDEALATWASTYAFQDPADQRFRMPTGADAVEWRRGVPAPTSHWTEMDARKSSAFGV